MKQENMARADFLTSILFIVFGAGVLANSMAMPTFAERGVNPFSAPGIVPGFLGAIVAFLGVVLLVRSMLRKGHRLGLNATTVRGFLFDESTKRLAITILVSVVYAIVLVGRITYPVSTGIYIFAFVLLFDLKGGVRLVEQWKAIVGALVIAVLTSAAVTAVFRFLFLVNLP